MRRRRKLIIDGVPVGPGQTRDIRIKVSQSYTGYPVEMPVRVVRAKKPGPHVFVTAAVHGDELNGTGIIRELLFGRPLDLIAGALICIPVVNIFGFESHDRYLPDRRDLNRSFPGSETGSLASRLAQIVFTQIVLQCDYGIDLHTAAVRRTNFPNVRGDLTLPGVRSIARAFGCELIVNEKGPLSSLRRESCKAGCPTIILEAGEVWKIEPGVLEVGVRGIRNVLVDLKMIDGQLVRPSYQTRVQRATWVRSEVGGILRFHVTPGDLIEAGQPIATNVSVLGDAHAILIAPVDAIVLGMTTLPACKPGEPVCHLAIPSKRLSTIRAALVRQPEDNAYQRLRRDLATNLSVYRLGGERGSG